MRTLDLAQKNSEACDLGKVLASSTSDEASDVHSPSQEVTGSLRKLCFFCGFSYHDRKVCPAKGKVCRLCKKKGHFAKVCRSTKTDVEDSFARNVPPDHTASLCAFQVAPECLTPATANVCIAGHDLCAWIDTGSSSSYVNERTAKPLRLCVEPSVSEFSMAASNLKGKVAGQCIVDVIMNFHKYAGVQ